MTVSFQNSGNRGIHLRAETPLRLIARDSLVELYLDDLLVQVFTLPAPIPAFPAISGGIAWQECFTVE